MGFTSIADGIKAQKGGFIGTVIKVSDLKEGTNKDGKDYIMQKFTFKDDSGEIELTAWNEETNLLQLGGKYEITPWWQGDYQGTQQIGLGKFGKVKLLEKGQTQQEMPTNPQPKNEVKLGELETSLKGIVHTNTILMLQIENEVEATMKQVLTHESIRGDKIGMFTRMNFYALKGMIAD